MLQTGTRTQQRATLSHTAQQESKQGCPHCGSLVWEQIRRTKLQKILRPTQGRCHCRSCQHEFWKTLH